MVWYGTLYVTAAAGKVRYITVSIRGECFRTEKSLPALEENPHQSRAVPTSPPTTAASEQTQK